MSQVKNEEELFERIEELQEELRKLLRDFLEYVAKKRYRHKKKKRPQIVVSSPPATTVPNVESTQCAAEKDTQCVVLLANGKRCSGKKSTTEGDDLDVCKRHNNAKFEGKLTKIEVPAVVVVAQQVTTNGDRGNEGEGNEDDESGETEDEPSFTESSDESANIAVKLTRDSDGDLIDQDGNIWTTDSPKIIGKKDLRTKQKVWLKTV